MKLINDIFESFHKDNPSPVGELNFVNEFTLLVAIVLSAQMTDIGVNKATLNLFKTCQTPDDFVNLGLDGITEHIKSINYYKTKAKHVFELSKILQNKPISKEFDELIKLPGVGRKTANVFLNSAFNLPHIGVDTHVARLSQRLGITKEKDPIKIEKDLLKKIPKQYVLNAHKWLVLHGRYICKAQKPKCGECILKDNCKYNKEKNAKS